MKRTLIFALAAVIIFGAPVAQAATGQHLGLSPMHATSTSSLAHLSRAAGDTCAKQLANDTGVGVTSQNFETGFDIYDNRGADDFTLAVRCTIATVQVAGTYYGGGGPADSLDVRIYADDGGTPGKLLERGRNLGYTDGTGTGSFNIPLAAPVELEAGTYWVSVRVNMNFSTGGEWGWFTNATARGSDAQWKNHGDGFDTGCVTYTPMKRCFQLGGGPDFTFALLK